MKMILSILREQFLNLNLIYRMATFEIKGKYQMHYLGVIWQILNPSIQVMIYWFVFGIGIRGGASVGEVPFFVWLLIGLIPWFFIGPTIIQGSNSVYSKISLVSKMKFPVSLLPTIVIVSNGLNFLIMLIIVEIILLINNIHPTIMLLQIPYYLLCTIIFLFSFTLLSSTLATIIRDYQIALQSAMRMLFYLSPILWVTSQLPPYLHTVLKLNPIYYLIDGYRNAFLGNGWFFNNLSYMLYFWILTLFIMYVGTFLHYKFKDKFIDYL